MSHNQEQSIEIQPLNEALWEFPMDYPIKLIGLAVPELKQEVEAIFLKNFPQFDTSTIEAKPSSKGTYHSIRALLRFDNIDQVHALYDDLKACKHIKTAL